MQEVIERLDLLEGSIDELKKAMQTSDKVKTTLQWCLTSVRKLLQGSDAALKLVRDLKQDFEIDYELHVKENLGGWSFESSTSCMNLRKILKPYCEAENPTLKSLKEEQELLALLEALRANEQGDADRESRSGYYRVLHRVVDSMKTLSGDMSEGTEHMRRSAQYACTHLCRFWNGGLPSYILSYSAGTPIALLSSEDVFRDMWRAMREKKYKRASRGRGTPQSVQSNAGSSSQGRALGSGSTANTPRASQSSNPSKHNTRQSASGSALRTDINGAKERGAVLEEDELSEPSDLDLSSVGKLVPAVDDSEDPWDLTGLRTFRMINADPNDPYSEVESVTESNRSTASASVAAKTRLIMPGSARSRDSGSSQPSPQASSSLPASGASGPLRARSLPPPQPTSGSKRTIVEAASASNDSSKSPQKQRPRY